MRMLIPIEYAELKLAAPTVLARASIIHFCLGYLCLDSAALRALQIYNNIVYCIMCQVEKCRRRQCRLACLRHALFSNAPSYTVDIEEAYVNLRVYVVVLCKSILFQVLTSDSFFQG